MMASLVTSTPNTRSARPRAHASFDEFSDSFLPQNLDCTEKESLQNLRGRKSIHANTCETKEVAGTSKKDEDKNKAISKLTQAEKEEHYNFCIKLSTENKITFKNVFNLHLIDYLSELVLKNKEMPSFQMASITLQASSKIFGLRVDYLYSTALHILGNLTSKKKHRDGEDAEKSNVLADGGEDMPLDENLAPNKKPKSKKKARSFIVTNISSLDHKFLPTNQMPHKKFHQVTAILEQSSTQRFFCHLPIINDECQVSLCQPHTYIQEKKPLNPLPSSGLPEKLFGLNSVMKSEHVASATLEDFSYFSIRWPLDGEELCPFSESEEHKNLRMAFDKIDFSKTEMPQQPNFEPVPLDNVDLPDVSIMSDGHDNAFADDGDVPILDAANDQLQSEAEPNIDVNNDNLTFADRTAPLSASAGIYLPPGPSTPRITVADISRHLSQSQRSFMNQSQLGALGLKVLRAQYEHLKKPSMEPQEKKGEKKSRTKKSMYLPVEDGDDSDIDDLQKTFAPGKRTVLTKAAPQQWINANTLLPSWCNNNMQLLALFKKPYEFNDKQEEVNSEHDDDDCLDPEFEPMIDFNSDSILDRSNLGDPADPFMNDNVPAENGVTGITMVPEPPKVKRDVISYEKIAKKIDQKVVKVALWKVLRRVPDPEKKDSEGDYSLDPESESEVSDAEVPIAMSFSTAFTELKKALPTKISENISVHMAFVILLQLGNEHGLLIKGNDARTDAKITRGQD